MACTRCTDKLRYTVFRKGIVRPAGRLQLVPLCRSTFSKHSSLQVNEGNWSNLCGAYSAWLCRPVQTIFVAAAATALLWQNQPALAEIQTVAAQDATSLARSLPKQKVNKGKVWIIFLVGATTLFGAAVAIEKNAAIFPAIAKANKAMAASRQQSQTRDDEAESIIETTTSSASGSEAAVLQGLQDARSKGQESSASSMPNEDSKMLGSTPTSEVDTQQADRAEAASEANAPPRTSNGSKKQREVASQSPSGS